MSTVTLTLAELAELARRALMAADTSQDNARCVADALVAAEADGHIGHGASRIPSYAAQARSGKVDGHAVPEARRTALAVVRIDAKGGFACPALTLAAEHLRDMVRETGLAAASVHHSHHAGAAGYHVEKLASQGLIGLLLSNTPEAIAPWGGKTGVYGNNPIDFAAPRANDAPLVVDMSIGLVARGKIMVAAREGQPIPEGWALDTAGRPTTDAKAALEGTLTPIGGAKGAALAMVVEILAAALSGARFGFEASSFFTAEGPPPGVGQILMAFDPEAFSGGAFAERLESLIAAILAQPGVRLPGTRRLAAREEAAREGIRLSQGLVDEIRALAKR